MMYMILVDTGSSVDIIFWDAFERMGIGAENLRPTRSPLKGFNGDPLCPEGVITLPVVLGEAPRTASASANFLVVRCSSSYNAIMGRPLLHMLAAVPSSYHMKLKFHTERGMGEVRGDQPASRRCYLTALKDKGGESSRASEALALEGLDPEDQEREARRPTPVEKLKVLPLLEGDPAENGATWRLASPRSPGGAPWVSEAQYGCVRLDCRRDARGASRSHGTSPQC
ncbi:hypothetical protein J5N97_011882 [Dioscorea zingiberensis]|uniref:Uncharacterized protein n=1 Tax=Dioscorea zingiberensis TaxID=325984 RepID=A0A9D5HPZ8_9LILI|nr:hypothetical protein J5N97_011882 [Dioscorea zingiberensis]